MQQREGPAIEVRGARTHNLRDLDVTVRRGAITVFTGVSGSGKSSLVLDTIAAEAQHQLNETFTAFVRNRLPSRGRPEVDAITGLSPVVIVDQRRLGGGARSTVGTVTDIGAVLRLLFSRASDPVVGESTAFSFNDPAGMCLTCSGTGQVVAVEPARLLDPGRSLRSGAIQVPGYRSGQWAFRRHVEAGPFDLDVPTARLTAAQRDVLLHGGSARSAGTSALREQLPDGYEGLAERFERIYVRASGEDNAQKRKVLDQLTHRTTCPECGGSRLNEAARTATVGGLTIVQMSQLEVTALRSRAQSLRVRAQARPVLEALVDRLTALSSIGLGYLTLARPSGTLSGGESQRVKLVRHLGSSLIQMLYVFDEPSVGLHPADVERLTRLLRELRDKGNTVLVVEHDPQVIAVADEVIDIGPGPGARRGRLVFQGPVRALRRDDGATGRAMRSRPRARTVREPHGWFRVREARRNNLQGVSVDVPTGVLCVVTGVAGSGKSSLVQDLLLRHPGRVVDQRALSTNRRSVVATWTGVAEPLRELFARTHGVSPSLFSPNSAPGSGGGACPACAGLGVVVVDLAFMESLSVRCDACGGDRFRAEVLALTVDGRSIADVLALAVDDAAQVFQGLPEVGPRLAAVAQVGLGYLTLGQPLPTLSGGEGQRLKLSGRPDHSCQP